MCVKWPLYEYMMFQVGVSPVLLKPKNSMGGSPHVDQRGRHAPANKTSDVDTDFVKEHIRSFPKYKSHYSRASNPHRQYLSPDLSITKMHVLYVDVCSTQGKHAVSEWVYRKIFNETFNLSFGRYVYDPLSPSLSPSLPPLPPSLPPSLPPFSEYCAHYFTIFLINSLLSPKTDACKTCDTFKVQIDGEKDEVKSAQLRAELDLHLCKAERSYQVLKEVTALSRIDANILTITFDLQQSLPTPMLSTNVVFYKRQLWTFIIHVCISETFYVGMALTRPLALTYKTLRNS